MHHVIVSSAFDSFKSRDMRFLEEAAKLGEVHVLLWSDEAITALTGCPPQFPYAERRYFVQATRYVKHIQASGPDISADVLPNLHFQPGIWAVSEKDASATRKAFCATNGIAYRIITDAETAGFPAPPPQPSSGRKKVVVTGCYDWFHTGHVAFFEEVSGLGDLYVVAGNDANLLLLKGEGHPMFSQEERRYTCGSIRYVTEALISSGSGWMDAEPEILQTIKPDMYAVNEDGDKPEKREFCKTHGIEFVVLKRLPKEGLTRRSSTDLRGF